MENDISLYFEKYRTDKCKHGFLEIYNRYLEPLREKDIRMMEIGIFKGRSIKMWREYFKEATIHAIDCCDWRLINGMNKVESFLVNQSVP